MKFPVDLLADVSQATLEESAHNYMNNLLYSNPDFPEHLTLSDSTKVSIVISRVGYVPLYGSSDKQRILALFSPSDPLTAVALYLLDRWWTVDDLLKTADHSRDGAVTVDTFGERIVLYILNRVIYRAKEINTEEELPFLCHGEKDYAKIYWSNGEAIGFYSVKPSGTLCNPFSTRSYQLPVMDSIFVRKCHRGKGFGLQMLEDFVLTFQEDCLGLRYPLTKAMFKVCKKFLSQYPGDTDLLWEVENVGGPNQRYNISKKIQTMDLSAVSKNLSFTEESHGITAVTERVMEAITTQIEGAESMECTVEIVEEVTLLTVTKEAEGVPVVARSRSSGSKQKKTGDKIVESRKVIRIEDIEAETPEEQNLEQQKTEVFQVSEGEQMEVMLDVATEEDEAHSAPEEAASAVTDKPATVLPSQDLEGEEEEGETEEKEDGTKPLIINSCEPQITVENVSEIEKSEEPQEEETTVLVVCKHVPEVFKDADALKKVGRATKVEVLKKKAKLKQSSIPRRKSQRHSRAENSKNEELTAKDGSRVLRGRTVVTSPILKRRLYRRSQKVSDEVAKEITEVSEDKEGHTTEEAELTVETGTEETEDTVEEQTEHVTDEETDILEKSGLEDSVVEGDATKLPDTEANAVIQPKEDGKGIETETSEIPEKAASSDDETEEAPVVVLKGRHRVSRKVKSTKGRKRHQKDKTDEADLGTDSVPSKEAEDEQVQIQGQVEQDEIIEPIQELPTVEPSAVEEGGADSAQESLTEVKLDVNETQEEGKTTEVTETVHMVLQDSEEDAGSVIEEVGKDKTATPEAEEPQEKDTETTKLQKATVILVDLKHLSTKETDASEERAALALEAEGKEALCSDAEGQSPEPENLEVEKEETETKDLEKCSSEIQKAEITNVTETEETRTEMEVDEAETDGVEAEAGSAAVAEQAAEEKQPGDTAATDDTEQNLSVEGAEEDTPVVESRVLRSGTKTVVLTPCKSAGRRKQEEQDETATEKEETEVTSAEQIQEQEQQETEAEDAGQEAALEKTGEVTEEMIGEEMGEEIKEDAILKQEQSLEPEVEEVAEQSEVISKILEDKEAEASVQECSNEGAVEGDAGVETPPKTRSSRSKRSKAEDEPLGQTRMLRSGRKVVCRRSKKMQQEELGPQESTSADLTEDEAEACLAEELLTENDEDDAKEGHGVEMEREETPIEEVTLTAPVTVTEMAEDADKTDEPEPALDMPTADSSHEGETPPAVAAQLKEDIPSQRSDIQQVTVVLMDVKKNYFSIQDTTKVAEEPPQEKTSAEKEDEYTDQVEDQGEEAAEAGLLQQDVPEERENRTSDTSEEAPAGEAADETLEDVANEAALEETTCSITSETATGESVQEAVLTEKEIETLSEEEDAPVVERRSLRRGKTLVTKRHDEEAAAEKSTEELIIHERVLRKGKKCVPATPRRKYKKRTQISTEEEKETDANEDIQVEQTQEVLEESQEKDKDEKTEEKDEEEPAIPMEENAETRVEKEKVELVAEGNLSEQKALEEESSAASETVTVEHVETADGESAEGEIQDEQNQEVLKDAQEEDVAGGTDEKNEEEAATQTELNTDLGVGIENVEPLAEESLAEQETLEEDLSAASKTATDEDTLTSNEGTKREELETIAVETKVLRGHRKTVKATPKSETAKSKKEEIKEGGASAENSMDSDEITAETRVLRKGRKSSLATPRRKSKRARAQLAPEEGKEVIAEEDPQEAQTQIVVEATQEKGKDGSTEDSNQEEAATVGEEKDGRTEDSNQEEAATVGEEKDGRTENSNQEEAATVGEEKDGRTEDSNQEEAATVGEEKDGRTEDSNQEEAATVGEEKDGRTENSNQEEAATVGEETPESEVGTEKAECVAEKSLTEQEVQSTASETATADQVETPVAESAEGTPTVDEGVADCEEATLVDRRVLRSVGKTVKTTPKSRTTKGKHEASSGEGASVEKTNDPDKPTAQARVLRKGRTSAPATPRRQSKRACRKHLSEDEEEEEADEEADVEQTHETLEEDQEKDENETADEKALEDAAAQSEEDTDLGVESVAEESLTEQKTPGEESASVSETGTAEQVETADVESAEQALATDEGKVDIEEEDEIIAESHQEENAEETAPAETRVLRKGTISTPASPRRKSKRTRKQLQSEEAEEEEMQTEVVLKEAQGGDAEGTTEEKEEEAEKAEPEVETEKVESEADEPPEVTRGLRKQSKSTRTTPRRKAKMTRIQLQTEKGESETIIQTEESSVEKAEEKTAEEEAVGEETQVIEPTKPDEETPVVEELELVDDTSVVAEQESPAVTQKDAETLQQEEDTQQSEEAPELTEQEGTEETSTADEAVASAGAAQHQAEEAADPADEEIAEAVDKEEETKLPESIEDENVDPSFVESRSLRRSTKTVAEDANSEEIQTPKRRSLRKRPRVDYRENDGKEEDEMKVAIDEEEEDQIKSDENQDGSDAEYPASQKITRLESDEEENSENMEADRNTSEDNDALNLVMDTDEEHEQMTSEEEAEPIVIGKKVLRGRSVPSVTITPRAKSRRHTAKLLRAEECISEEESVKSPQSAEKRSLRKKRRTEVTPSRKSKRHRRV
ncbi:uncharacterized protein ACBR49_003322 [Aulostomus maculatus]